MKIKMRDIGVFLEKPGCRKKTRVESMVIIGVLSTEIGNRVLVLFGIFNSFRRLVVGVPTYVVSTNAIRCVVK